MIKLQGKKYPGSSRVSCWISYTVFRSCLGSCNAVQVFCSIPLCSLLCLKLMNPLLVRPKETSRPNMRMLFPFLPSCRIFSSLPVLSVGRFFNPARTVVNSNKYSIWKKLPLLLLYAMKNMRTIFYHFDETFGKSVQKGQGKVYEACQN